MSRYTSMHVSECRDSIPIKHMYTCICTLFFHPIHIQLSLKPNTLCYPNCRFELHVIFTTRYVLFFKICIKLRNVRTLTCVNETGVFIIIVILLNSVTKIEKLSNNASIVRDAFINVVYNIIMLIWSN